MEKTYALRDAAAGKKTASVSLALDPVTRTKFEIAARRQRTSLANYVTQAAQSRLAAEDANDSEPMHMPNGERVTMHALGCLITADTESRQFMRMAFIAPHLLRVTERIRFARIVATEEFWLRDPRESAPLRADFSEPSEPVFNYALLEERWAELLRSERDKDALLETMFKPALDRITPGLVQQTTAEWSSNAMLQQQALMERTRDERE